MSRALSSPPRSGRPARRGTAPPAESCPSSHHAPNVEPVCRRARSARPPRRSSMAVEVPTPTGPARPDLTILETRIYRGPNVWSYQQAVHLVVDLGSLEEYPTVSLPGFTDRLLELVPGLERHTCSLGRRGGFVERLREGTWLGHVAEHGALQPQTLGRRARRGRAAARGGRGAPRRKAAGGQGPPGSLHRRLQLHRRDGGRRGRQA